MQTETEETDLEHEPGDVPEVPVAVPAAEDTERAQESGSRQERKALWRAYSSSVLQASRDGPRQRGTAHHEDAELSDHLAEGEEHDVAAQERDGQAREEHATAETERVEREHVGRLVPRAETDDAQTEVGKVDEAPDRVEDVEGAAKVGRQAVLLQRGPFVERETESPGDEERLPQIDLVEGIGRLDDQEEREHGREGEELDAASYARDAQKVVVEEWSLAPVVHLDDRAGLVVVLYQSMRRLGRVDDGSRINRRDDLLHERVLDEPLRLGQDREFERVTALVAPKVFHLLQRLWIDVFVRVKHVEGRAGKGVESGGQDVEQLVALGGDAVSRQGLDREELAQVGARGVDNAAGWRGGVS